MKLIPLAFLIIVLLVSSRVQAQVRSESPQETSRMAYAGEMEKYRRIKTAGAIMTGVGTVLFITGAIMIDNGNDSGEKNDPTWGKGVGFLMAGVAGVGTGIPIWSVGGYKYKKYKKLVNSSASLNIKPHRQGVSLVLRF